MFNLKKFKRVAQYGLSFSVTLVFFYFIFHETNMKQIKSLVMQANTTYIILAFFSLCIGYLIRGYRWSLMLARVGAVLPRTVVINKFLYAIALNNILPFRAGDIYRLFSLQKIANIDAAHIFGTLVLERLLDLLMLLALFFVTSHYIESSIIPEYVLRALRYLACLGFGFFVLLIFFPNSARGFLEKTKSIKIMQKNNLSIKIIDQLIKFVAAIVQMRSVKYLLKFFMLTLLAWLFEGGLFGFAAYAVQYRGLILGPFFASFAGALSTLLPSAPGYAGTFDYFTMLGLRSFGASVEVAIAAALLIHLLLWFPVTLFGWLLHMCSLNNKEKNILYSQD